jgi:hypothetical protein
MGPRPGMDPRRAQLMALQRLRMGGGGPPQGVQTGALGSAPMPPQGAPFGGGPGMPSGLAPMPPQGAPDLFGGPGMPQGGPPQRRPMPPGYGPGANFPPRRGY